MSQLLQIIVSLRKESSKYEKEITETQVVKVQRWLCTVCAHPLYMEVFHSQVAGGSGNTILAKFRPQLFLFKDYWGTGIDSHLQ